MLVSILSREGGLDGLNYFCVLYKEDVAAASSNSPTPAPILPCGIHVPWQSPPKWTGLTREPTAHWGNDGVWFLKLGPKRHCSFLCVLLERSLRRKPAAMWWGHSALWRCPREEEPRPLINSQHYFATAMWVSHPGSGASRPSHHPDYNP